MIQPPPYCPGCGCDFGFVTMWCNVPVWESRYQCGVHPVVPEPTYVPPPSNWRQIFPQATFEPDRQSAGLKIAADDAALLRSMGIKP